MPQDAPVTRHAKKPRCRECGSERMIPSIAPRGILTCDICMAREYDQRIDEDEERAALEES